MQSFQKTRADPGVSVDENIHPGRAPPCDFTLFIPLKAQKVYNFTRLIHWLWKKFVSRFLRKQYKFFAKCNILDKVLLPPVQIPIDITGGFIESSGLIGSFVLCHSYLEQPIIL